MQGYAGPVQQGDMVVRANEVSPGITALLSKQNRKGAQGIYELPSAKQPVPNYYNAALDNVQNEIRSAARTVNAMAPEGERLAYINPQEEGILRLLGGSGEPEPVTGIPSYRPPGFAGGAFDKRPSRNSGFQGSIGGGGGGNSGSSRPKTTKPGTSGGFTPKPSKSSPRPSAPKPSSGDRNILRDLEDAMAKREEETGVKMAPRITEPSKPKEDKNIFEKIVGSIFGEPDPEVKAAQAKAQQLIDQVDKSGLTNYQKIQLKNQIKFAASPEARRTGYSMTDLVNMMGKSVPLSIAGKTDLTASQINRLPADQKAKAIELIEKYQRPVVMDPMTGEIKVSAPTGMELLKDAGRATGDILSDVGIPGVPFSSMLFKGKPKMEEDKISYLDILKGEGLGLPDELDGGEVLRLAQQDPRGIDPLAIASMMQRPDQDKYSPLTAQVSGAMKRVQEGDRDRGGNNIPSVQAPVTDTTTTTTEDEIPYFSYYRRFRQPMTYEDIIKRAYEGSDGPLLETLQEAMDRPKAGIDLRLDDPVLFGGK